MVVYPAGRASLAVLAEKDARLSHVLFATRKAAALVAEILDSKK